MNLSASHVMMTDPKLPYPKRIVYGSQATGRHSANRVEVCYALPYKARVSRQSIHNAKKRDLLHTTAARL